jgi:hypothetical protein
MDYIDRQIARTGRAVRRDLLLDGMRPHPIES